MVNVIAKYRSISSSLIFILFGFYFYISAHENSAHHNNVLFGLTEMTWMWLIMGVSHFFVKNCDCKK